MKFAGRGHPAFTLAECIAVVALVTLAVGVIALGASSTVQGARLREARSMLLDLDARARALALGAGSVRLGVEGGGASVSVGEQNRPIVSRDLPGGVEVVLIDPRSREALRVVSIGAGGLSQDYVLLLRADGSASETLVCGLTGYAFPPATEDSR